MLQLSTSLDAIFTKMEDNKKKKELKFQNL